MANEQYAFIVKSKVPDRSAWQAQIDACGFDFQLDPQLRSFHDSGFVPCKLHGRDSGFEIYYDGSKETLEAFSEVAGDHDYCISFRWGGDMSECASIMIASYVLAKSFGATVSYEGEPPYRNLDAFLAETRDAIQQANDDAGS